MLNTRDLQKRAYTIECFLKAIGLAETPARTKLEEQLVQTLAGNNKGDYVVYHEQQVFYYRGNKVLKSFAAPEASFTEALWSDGKSISRVDARQWLDTGKLLLLGSAGLGISAGAMAANQKNKKEQNNNNNG